MIKIDNRGYFVTGSDTDVGKTYIACQLIRQLRELGKNIEVRKPAESGCVIDSTGQLVTHDASQLSLANDGLQAVESISPYRFQAALAPHRAARLEGKRLYLRELIEACKSHHSGRLLLVEGAGGFYSPLAEDGLNADLAVALKLAVIIVVDDRIGAVNQSLLSIEAVENRGLSIAAVILNQTSGDHATDMDNPTDLSTHCSYPIFCCKYQQSLPTIFIADDNHD